MTFHLTLPPPILFATKGTLRVSCRSPSSFEAPFVIGLGEGAGVLNEFEMMCHLRILFPVHFFVFKQTVSHLEAETNVDQVFSRVGQLSEVNSDPDTLTDMVSIMINKHVYKPSVKDIMDKVL